jgi:hypothetical protein
VVATRWTRLRRRRGYAMLVALILIAIITIIGATSLSIAGVDERVAAYTRRHVAVMDAADAGSEHARMALMFEQPGDEGWDTGAPQVFVEESDSVTWFEGEDLEMPLGTYDVTASFAKCSVPPAGYSTEVGKVAFRSDYWDMESHSWFEQSSMGDDQINPSEARVVSLLRKVRRGSCKIR